MEACGSVAEEENESWLCVAQSVTLHASAGRAGGPLVRQARLAALLETPYRVRALQEGVRRYQVPALLRVCCSGRREPAG